jgi:hypothetical protein
MKLEATFEVENGEDDEGPTLGEMAELSTEVANEVEG